MGSRNGVLGGFLALVAGTSVTTGLARADGYPDGVYFVRMMPGSSLLQDITSDQRVTDNDVLIQISNKICGEIVDQDGDGQLTAVDTLLMIKLVIDACGGDLTGDKEVKVDDLLTWAAKFAQNPGDIKGLDVNGDFRADLLDYSELYSKIGSEIGYDYTSLGLAQRMYPLIVDLISTHGCSIDGSLFSASPTHIPLISDNYIPDGHLTRDSKYFPDNHLTDVSREWKTPIPANPGLPLTTPTIPAHLLQQSKELWPANHEQFISRTWGTPTGHATGTSETTPPIHETVLSDGWKRHPNHIGSISSTWYPDRDNDQEIDPEERHQTLISRTYLPGHSLSRSQDRQLPMHAEILSNDVLPSWRPVSPPNHTGSTSESWGPSHGIMVSVSFPPSHVGPISEEWDRRLIPWSPNHLKAKSEQETRPVPTFPRPSELLPPGFLPDGHSWFTTIREVSPR